MYRSYHSSRFNVAAKTSLISHSQNKCLWPKDTVLNPRAAACSGWFLSTAMVLLLLFPPRVLVPVVSNTLWFTTALKPSHQLLSPELQEYLLPWLCSLASSLGSALSSERTHIPPAYLHISAIRQKH